MNRHNIIVQNLELAKLSKANFEPLARDRCLGDRNFLVHTAQELVRSNTSLLSFSVALQVLRIKVSICKYFDQPFREADLILTGKLLANFESVLEWM